MILQELYRLYDRFESDPEYDVAPPDKSIQKISFVVVLDPDGTLIDIQDGRQEVDGRKMPHRIMVPGKTKPSGSGLNPCFLWDSAAYLLGWHPKSDMESKKAQRAHKAFMAFKEKHLELEQELSSHAFSAVCRFLEKWDPVYCLQHPVLEEIEGGFGLFQLRGETEYVHEKPEIQNWWNSQVQSDHSAPEGQCLITGRHAIIARLHDKIKRVDGSLSAGATIAGFNDPAYESYGLIQSFNAPVSEDAVHKYTTALNILLDGPKSAKHRLIVGGTTIVFWTERPCTTEDIFLAFAEEGSEAIERIEAQDETVRLKIQAFLKALRKGSEVYGELGGEPSKTDYFILGLAAPTPARIAVRFFHRGTLVQLLDSLRRHHSDIGMERQYGSGSKHPDPEFPSIQLLLDQTCTSKGGRPDREKIPKVLAGPVLESVVAGSRYPDGLFAAIMRRVTGERIINYARACIIKGYLVRNIGKEVPMTLDITRTEPSYRLGRLFAALEKTQKDALPSINTTIRDSFYSAASSTPAIVFPRLLRTYQHHLAKLEGGLRVVREKLVQEILAPLSHIPAHLGLAEQGLFAIGYYHQMNAFFAKKEDRDNSKQN